MKEDMDMIRSLKKVLVTGASGFIGREVASRLMQLGYEVHGFVRQSSETDPLLDVAPDIVLHFGDINDQRALALAMQDVQWVIHCAGVNSFWERRRKRYRQVNTQGTRNVMLIAHEAGVEKVINVSTAMTYGFPEEMPFDELREVGTHASEYAHSKFLGDREAYIRYKKQGLPLVTVYLAAVLGAGDDKDVMQVGRFLEGRVPLMINSPYRFTYLYIKDAVDAIVRAAEKEGNIGERYLVGDQRLTTREYFEIISELSGVPMPTRTIGRIPAMALAGLLTAWANLVKKPPLMPLDLIRTVYKGDLIFDDSKAKSELGMSYIPIRKVLEETVDDLIESQTEDYVAESDE